MSKSATQTILTAATLFDNSYFDYRFPKPQYLGSKFDHLKWIGKYIPHDVHTVLDAFSGTQSVAFYLKQLGLSVTTNDFMSFSHHIGLALVENKGVTLGLQDLEMLFDTNNAKGELMETTFENIFFVRQECKFLDNFRANITRLKNKYKQALAITIMNRAMQRKIIMGHFAHTKAIDYANSPERVRRNKSISLPLKSLFLEQLPLYNQAIFDNGQPNISYHENILDLLPKISAKIDLVYFDPPYVDSHSDYQSFYHLLETYTMYWQDKDFINGTKRYSPARFSGFDKKTQIKESLENLFQKSVQIPHWLISWNDRSFPLVDDFVAIINKYKNVEVIKKPYVQSRGGKGSVKGSSEILFVCSPKI